MKIFLLILVTSLTSFTHANTDWFEKGNGGTVMACEGQAPRTLDLFEAENIYGWQIDQSHAQTVEERVHYIFDKLKTLNPYRTSQYRNWFSTFYKETEFVSDASLGPVPDLGKINIPNGCDVKQVVFQRQPNQLNSHRYTISLQWWNQLTVPDQAAMILHELIYRELALPPNLHATSEFSRRLNGWFNTEDFQNTDLEKYLRFLQNVFVVNAEFDKYQILLNVKDVIRGYWLTMPLSFDSTGEVTLTLNGNQGLSFTNHFMTIQCEKKADEIATAGVLSLSKDRLPKKLAPLKNRPVVKNCKHVLFSKDIPNLRVEGDVFNFDSEGDALSAFAVYEPQNSNSSPVRSKDRMVTIGTTGSPIQLTTYFDKSGDVGTITFNSKACMPGANEVLLSDAPAENPSWTSLSLNPSDKEFDKLPACH